MQKIPYNVSFSFARIFYLVLLLTLVYPSHGQAQGDAKARDLLRRMNANYKSFRTMTADFSFTLEHPSQRINEQHHQ